MKNTSNVSSSEISGLRKWLPLVVMGLAIIIIVLDTTLLNVSLGTIVRELNTDISSLQWVIAAYSLTLAAFTITGGRLGDLFGRRKMFNVGAIIFALGSFIASVSPNVGWLIIGESIIEGIGAAMMMPASASLLVSTYRGRDRALALGIWGGMAAAGSAIGPILGGYLTSHYSWRWGFRINVFVAIILLLGSFVIKEARDREEQPRLDILGVMLSASGLFFGVFAIIQGSHIGWLYSITPLVLGSVAITLGSFSVVPLAVLLSIALLGGFYMWERRLVSLGGTPLVSMDIFKNVQFTSGAFTSAFLALGQSGMIFALPVFLQSVKRLDALHTGLAMLPLSVGLLLMAPLGGLLGGRFTPKRIVQSGLLVNASGLLLLRFVLAPGIELNQLIVPLFMYGAGVGLGMSQLSNLTLSAVSVNESGEASGVNNTLRQIGSSLGSAIIGTVLVVTLSSSLRNGVLNDPVISERNKPIVATEIAEQASAVEFGAALKSQAQLNSNDVKAIEDVVRTSTVKANKTALTFTVMATLLALLVSTKLPYTKNVEKNESLAAAH